MKFVMRYIFRIIYWPILLILSLYHFPRFYGRKNVPQGAAVLCCNHSALLDPVWVVLAINDRKIPWIMAKKEVMDKPVIGKFLSAFGAFGVDREHADFSAIKTSLRHLREGDKLLIFPEGTRIKKGIVSQPKSGAILLANRAGVPVVPIYLTHGRKPFQPIKCVIGAPFEPKFAGCRPTAEELEQSTKDLMQTIYGMAEGKK